MRRVKLTGRVALGLGALALLLWLRRRAKQGSAKKAESKEEAEEKLDKAKDAMATRPTGVSPCAPAGTADGQPATNGEARTNDSVKVVKKAKVVNGEEASEGVTREYFVDNSVLQATTPGLGYRRTKSSADRVEDAWEPWGNKVRGVDEGDWLRVGKLFLPKTLGGVVVLHSKGNKKPARTTAAPVTPQYVEYLASWPTCSDFETELPSASSSVRSAEARQVLTAGLRPQ
ncbi:unnamed protein product [Durusdinium trenchii]|uniref:Uncharacterized protein n=1 Tax=Durusdinium trenchii TaxID=1381693 RepID=A0ABP0I510_9DINO